MQFLLTEPVADATRPLDQLTALTVGYLALPNLVFIFCWFKLPVALLLALLVLIALYQSGVFNTRQRPAHSRAALLFLLVAAFVWSAFGGAGHFGNANPDWLVRDAVYADLFKNTWPIAYGMDGHSPMILRSAIGYFLPPALLTQWLGMRWADILLFAWTAIGVGLFLFLLPLPARLGKFLLVCALIVIMFSGMDFLGVCVAAGELPIFPLRMEWWTYFSYSSLGGQLFWAPNHTLPLWLGTALYIRHSKLPEFGRLATSYVPLTLIWTPFAAVALAPFLALYTFRWWHTRSPWPYKLQWVYALVICGLFSIFLTLNISGIDTMTGVTHARGVESFLRAYLLFITIEFLTLALLLWERIRQVSAAFVLAVVILLALPFTFFGPSNDLLLRASVPPLLILLCHALALFDKAPAHGRRFPWTIAIVLLIGAATPFNEMWRAVFWLNRAPNYGVTLVDVNNGHYPPHYIGRLDLPWLAGLLKQPHPIQPRTHE